VVAYGLHYQSLASQDGSEVVQDKIVIKIFFKSLQPESIQTQTGVQLGETLTAVKKMVSSGAVQEIEIDSFTTIQSCDSCKYAKTTCKPIKKSCEELRASRFGNEIHSDVWIPSPV
jgi:hypothetical protein